ncbi:AAA family ATPase [Methanospirillum sp. J.3.6.1-F.2.7.3]|uniref:AAA family ATPase n=1 Tax=Methanospirillum purgamenti TaxID=2834276 RepID=A0A8E7B2R6_9EURY|nr:AAA family ATPase [Methanospirillum sp. J.3.6.1-F.2.7.3]QVV89829.1 AAA family ATPase [Methanospirillum sp. J.3.6.1-F.2.7.3]
MELKISGVASYKSPVKITIDKKINLFYGLNGSGKTTIANFLQNRNHECYRHCCISGADDKKFIVYNENFIDENFYESVEQKGIFTLGIENKEAESNIENARNQIGQLNDKKQECEELIKWKKSQNNENENGIKERVWRIKTSYENSALDFCLVGVKNNKERLFDTLLGTEPEMDTSITIHDLESDIKKIEGDDAIIKATIPRIPLNTIQIENNDIFQEIIIGNEDNSLSKLINDLGNSDWVKSGIHFLDSQNRCPFCQRELESNLISKLRDYFDENYKQKINALNDLKTQYLNEILKFPDIEELKSEKLVAECLPFIEELLSLKNILDQNLASIEKKIIEPSKKLNLIETSEYLKKIDRYITEINNNIQIHNENIQNKEEFKKRIKKAFWGCASATRHLKLWIKMM